LWKNRKRVLKEKWMDEALLVEREKLVLLVEREKLTTTRNHNVPFEWIVIV
jgi:hypothetical protein